MRAEDTFKDTRKYVDIDLISTKNIPLFKKLMINERKLDFFNYLFRFNIISKKPDTLVLSSIYHYFYSGEDFDKVRVIVNLTELNKMPKLMNFLEEISGIAPGTVFCGCFIENKPTLNNLRTYAKLMDIMKSLVDFNSKRLLNRKDVTTFFEGHNFNIIDMRKINGITYFYVKKL